jgi:hypothetical protein
MPKKHFEKEGRKNSQRPLKTKNGTKTRKSYRRAKFVDLIFPLVSTMTSNFSAHG